MPDRDHLRRLSQVWIPNPIFFITVCVHQRRPLLTLPGVSRAIVESFADSFALHGWAIGRYVIMPDHIHYFTRPAEGAKRLSNYMRDWKRWTGNSIRRQTRAKTPIWQPEFFDHVLRSAASYSGKWVYVQANPVRAGLVARTEDWPHAGEVVGLSF